MILGRALGFILIGATPLLGMFVLPQPAPVGRLLKSADDYLAHHPKDAKACYTLARIHYLAFAMKSESVRGYAAPFLRPSGPWREASKLAGSDTVPRG